VLDTTTQANANNVNKKSILLQTTGGKDEPNIVVCGNRNRHHNTKLGRDNIDNNILPPTGQHENMGRDENI
jgi:hypothetical protein